MKQERIRNGRCNRVARLEKPDGLSEARDFSHEFFTKAVIKDMKMLSDLQLNADTIVIDDDNERVKESLAKYGLAYAKTIELTEKTRSLGYIDVDGIVYSADRKTLLVCPGRRTKPVNIPEGTEVISAFAFADSMIESVSMPDS